MIDTLENIFQTYMFDAGQVSHFVSTGVLNLMKGLFSVVLLVGLMFYQNWKLASFAIFMIPLAGGFAKNLGKQVGKATTPKQVNFQET